MCVCARTLIGFNSIPDDDDDDDHALCPLINDIIHSLRHSDAHTVCCGNE